MKTLKHTDTFTNIETKHPFPATKTRENYHKMNIDCGI